MLTPERYQRVYEIFTDVCGLEGPARVGAIARHCAQFIGDGSVIQTGVGAVPDAILRLQGQNLPSPLSKAQKPGCCETRIV